MPTNRARKFRHLHVWAVFTLFVLAGCGPAAGAARGPANLLLITIDTWRGDRLDGIEARSGLTPNLARIVKTGACFTRAFAHTPTTLASHVNILTGTTPPFHGVHDNFNFTVRADLPLLSDLLKKTGYATGAFIGAYPLDARFGLDRGFDVYDDDYSRRHEQPFTSPERRAEDVVKNAEAWIRAQAAPWFAWVHCYDPHAPYEPPEPFRSRHAEAYDGEVAYVDAVLGGLFEDLTRAQRMRDTLVVITGDHGESLGEHGEETHAFFAYNSTLWIPLIFAGKEIKPRRIASYVSHIDIFPTICDLLNIPAPADLQGRSLKPLLQGKNPDSPIIYLESLYPYYSRSWAPIRGFISKAQKFIDSPIPELYRLDEDFHEKRNAITSQGFAENRRRLADLMSNLSDPAGESARAAFDRKSMEKLSSLGYLSGGGNVKKRFTRDDDVKRLLPAFEETEDAWALFQAGKEAEAVRRLQSVIEQTPNLDMAYKRLAGIHNELRRYERSLEVLRAGREKVPSSYEIYVDYVKTLNNAGRFREAVREIRNSAFTPVESDPEMWYNLGLALSRTGGLEEATRALEKGYALDERYPELVELMAEVAFQQAARTRDSSRLGRAEQLFKQAMELDPDYARAYNGLGQTYRAMGRLDDAIRLWETAQEKEPDHPGSLFNLGAGLLQRGEPKKALPHLQRYKQLYAGRLSPELRRNLESLIARCLK